MAPRLTTRVERWPIAGTFTIARGSKTEAVVVIAEIADGPFVGRGECVPYARYGETVEGVEADVRAMADAVAGGLDSAALQTAMKAGAARNALDCALVDLAAKRAGTSAAALLGLPPLQPVVTAYTLSLGTPEAMGAAAAAASTRPLLKIKLGGAGDPARLAAVRAGAPNATLIVDANEGWTDALFAENMAACAKAGVALVEQPLPADADGMLADVPHAVPVCADESLHTAADIPRLAGLYDAVNIKLDKAGGVTEALAIATAARAHGLKVMVGCMLGSSLAMAPAVLVAQGADFVDLDGPLLLARDCEPGLVFDGSTLMPPRPELWG